MEFANELNINPDLDFIYSDEDKLSENGEKDILHFLNQIGLQIHLCR